MSNVLSLVETDETTGDRGAGGGPASERDPLVSRSGFGPRQQHPCRERRVELQIPNTNGADPGHVDARRVRLEGGREAPLRKEVHMGSLEQVPRHYPVAEPARDRGDVRDRDQQRFTGQPGELADRRMRIEKVLDHLAAEHAGELPAREGRWSSSGIECHERRRFGQQVLANPLVVELQPEDLSSLGTQRADEGPTSTAKVKHRIE